MAEPTVDVLRTKIDRHCPRCGAHRYHWLLLKPGKRPLATCAECSHSWNCRVLARDGVAEVAV